MLVEINNKTKRKINEKAIKDIVAKFLLVHKLKNKEVSIAFIGDKRMRDLNNAYRHKDRPTDILTFDGEGDFLGEVIIDLAQIERQARKFSNGSFKKELYFILVHGLFHLIGHTDDTERSRLKMIAIGEKFITKYNIY